MSKVAIPPILILISIISGGYEKNQVCQHFRNPLGDIVSIDGSDPSCDKSLLALVCLVSEAHLTGEYIQLYTHIYIMHTLVNPCIIDIESVQNINNIT